MVPIFMHLTHRVCLLSSPLSSPTPPNSYTFDRLGNAFRRGVVVHVSILPLLIAIIPTWIAAVALVIIHARKCCCSGEKEYAGAITVARPQEPGGAVGELARAGGRRLLRGRGERAVRQLFRIIEEEGEDDAEEGGGEGSGKGCCKSLMLRRLWRSMTE
jgi:hypothetical protein